MNTRIVPSWLYLPAGTDIRDAFSTTNNDVVEVPTNSGNFYNVIGVGDVGRGYTNWFLAVCLLPSKVNTPRT